METHGIHRAIAAIKARLAGGGGIGKNGKAMGYAFRGIEDIDNVLCGMTAEHGIVIYPRVVQHELRDMTTAKGGYQAHAILLVNWDFVCMEDGSTMRTTTMGEAMDTQDKACNKAMQASRKYALIMTFMIPVAGDDIEIYVPEPAGKPAGLSHTPMAETILAHPAPIPDPLARQVSTGALLPAAEPAKRTRGPNKPKETVVADKPFEQQVNEAVVAKAEANGVSPELPFPAHAHATIPARDEDPQGSLLGRIGEVNTFQVLLALAEEADKYVEPGRTELMTAAIARAVYIFSGCKNGAEAREGFKLVTAFGSPDVLKKAANNAYMRGR